MKKTAKPTKSLEETCFARTGSDATTENLREHERQFRQILESQSEEIKTNLFAMAWGGGPVAASLKGKRIRRRNIPSMIIIAETFVVTCPLKQIIIDSHNNVKKLLESCLTTNEAETLHDYITAIEATYEFVCHNESHKFQAFLEAGGFQHLFNHKNDTDECHREANIGFLNLSHNVNITALMDVKTSEWCR